MDILLPLVNSDTPKLRFGLFCNLADAVQIFAGRHFKLHTLMISFMYSKHKSNISSFSLSSSASLKKHTVSFDRIKTLESLSIGTEISSVLSFSEPASAVTVLL